MLFVKKINKNKLQRIFAIIVVFVIAVSVVTASYIKVDAVTCSTISACEAMKKAKEDDKTAYQAELSRLKGEADTLQNALAKLASEKAIIQAQIDINQAEYDRLSVKIAETEKKIQDNKDTLGKTMANMYVDGKISPLEMLASSKNIGDYLDKQEYQTSISNQLSSTIAEIKTLKESLEAQKNDVEAILNSQNNAKQALVDKETEQQNLLAQTQGQEDLYNSLSDAIDSDLEAIANAYKLLTNTVGVGISDPNKGNYPWGGGDCYVSYTQIKGVWSIYSFNGNYGDGVDALNYACRQCTSYAIWKVIEHKKVPESGYWRYAYWGNAQNWPFRSGFPYGTTAKANSVGVQIGGNWGHVVWVESEPDSEGNIIISQYNSYYDNTGDNSGPGWGNYSKKKVSASDYQYFIYVDE